jgi:hypothetical protein
LSKINPHFAIESDDTNILNEQIRSKQTIFSLTGTRGFACLPFEEDEEGKSDRELYLLHKARSEAD